MIWNSKDTPFRGELHGRAKLTEAQVREIRASPLSWVKLSAIYGVDSSVIGKIKKRKLWAHVP